MTLHTHKKVKSNKRQQAKLANKPKNKVEECSQRTGGENNYDVHATEHDVANGKCVKCFVVF